VSIRIILQSIRFPQYGECAEGSAARAIFDDRAGSTGTVRLGLIGINDIDVSIRRGNGIRIRKTLWRGRENRDLIGGFATGPELAWP
jgi:hypothetical protein